MVEKGWDEIGVGRMKDLSRYTGFAWIENGKTILSYSYPYIDTPETYSATSEFVQWFIMRLKPRKLEEEREIYGLTSDKWAKAVLYIYAHKFFDNQRKLRRFEDFLLSLPTLDTLYWYEPMILANEEARERIIVAMLIFFDFLKPKEVMRYET